MKRQQRIFDNEHVSFLHRRLQEHAFDSLKQLQKLTMDYAQTSGIEQWQKLWMQTLPTVAYHNTMIQQDMAKALLELHPILEEYAETAYQLYARLTYGRDINGNVNVLQVTFPPFYELFHTFLTWLCKHPAVSRLEVFSNFEVLDAASRAAFCDAMCVVLKNRVAIRQTLNKTQYKEKFEPDSRSPSPTRNRSRHGTAPSVASSRFSQSLKKYEDEDSRPRSKSKSRSPSKYEDEDSRPRSKSKSRSPLRYDDQSSATESSVTKATDIPTRDATPSPKRSSFLPPRLARRGASRSEISYSSKPSYASSVVQDQWVKNLKQSSSMIAAPVSKRAEVLPSESASQIQSTGKLFQRDRHSGSGTEGVAALASLPEARQVTVQMAAVTPRKPKLSPLSKSKKDFSFDDADEESETENVHDERDEEGF